MNPARGSLCSLLLLVLFAGAAAHAEECAKLVFNQFCLGGLAAEVESAGTTAPVPGGITLLSDGKRVNISVRDGRITGVAREEPPGSWINYVEWRNRLIRVYGRGEDRSDFPASSRSRSARFNAIVTGKGKAETRWEQDGWRVAVIWDNPDFVTLRYQLHEGAGSGGSRATEGL